jgi:hypothetical protein
MQRRKSGIIGEVHISAEPKEVLDTRKLALRGS